MKDISQAQNHVEATKKWIAALRNPGPYYQIRNKYADLEQPGGFCSLGLLAPTFDSNVHEIEFLLDDVVGLTGKESMSIVHLNDGAGEFVQYGPKTFAEVADYVEQVILPRRIAEADQAETFAANEEQKHLEIELTEV